jgi:hypothetical protein
LGYLALLINICAGDISQKVISLQLKGYTWIDWQFHVGQVLLHNHSHLCSTGNQVAKLFIDILVNYGFLPGCRVGGVGMYV